jgi:hypothetical protein
MGKLETIQRLLVEGASITETRPNGNTALLLAAQSGATRTVAWLLKEGGANIGDRNAQGYTALLLAAARGSCPTVLWLLENGADITDRTGDDRTVWSFLGDLIDFTTRMGAWDVNNDAAMVSALLRVMVLRDVPRASFVALLSPEHARMVQEGARLRSELPAYLAQRRALIAEHCPLIAPLQALVHSYETPTTTEELWATGIGATPRRLSRSDSEGHAAPPWQPTGCVLQ